MELILLINCKGNGDILPDAKLLIRGNILLCRNAIALVEQITSLYLNPALLNIYNRETGKRLYALSNGDVPTIVEKL